MTALLDVALFATLGFVTGVATGVVPGFHVNNAAIVLASSAPLLSSFSVEAELIAVMIVSAAVAHTFYDIVPSIFVGAPDPSTALTVLPGHRMMMEGRAREAIELSALGSGGAVVLALLIALPVRGFFEEVYGELLPYLGWALLVISAVMIVSERGRIEPFGLPDLGTATRARMGALTIFLLSGGLGHVALRADSLGAAEPVLGFEASILFPLLTGLFGTSTLLLSLLSSSEPPEQSSEPMGMSPSAAGRSVAGGTISGTIVGWLPGVTSAQAAVLAGQLTGEMDPGGPEGARSYLVSVSAVNSANAVFTLIALYTIGKARSGAMAAFEDLVPVSTFASGAPPLLIAALLGVAISALLSYVTLIRSSGALAAIFTAVDYRYLSVAVLAFLFAASLLFTGAFGVQVLVVGTAIGVLPPMLGVSRTHCMGCLLLPIMLGFFV